MRIININLPTVRTVHDFVREISSLDGHFDLLSEKYMLDARSLMGIFQLDLAKPIRLQIENDTEKTMSVIERFIAKPIANR